MRLFVLSVSTDRAVGPIRNAVLAHAGYGVIPVASADAALRVLAHTSVAAVVISYSVTPPERQKLCFEARKLNIPTIVLDSSESYAASGRELHVNPLDGPEVLLKTLAQAVSAAGRRNAC